jgi:hypothetical protein
MGSDITSMAWLKLNTMLNYTCQMHNKYGNDDFILAHQVKQVYYLKSPCQKLVAWWIVYKVNPR